MAGGASREIFAFDLEVAGRADPLRLVLRMDPAPGRIESDRAAEYELLRAAADAGVTVPHVHWLGTPSDGLPAAFVVMDRVGGQAIARPLLRDDEYATARAALPAQLARELARIRRIPLERSGLAVPACRGEAEDGRRFALAELSRYRQALAVASTRPHPVLALAARWLEQNAPVVGEPSVGHGDCRIGNIMYDDGGLAAVLDWELAHVGDPLEDVGWLSVRAWRFGNDGRAVGGLCSRRRFWRLYEQETGCPVDPCAALYWELFGNWKWAIICIMQASAFRSGAHPNLELAAIGRRVAEVEWELLSLLDLVDLAECGDPERLLAAIPEEEDDAR